MRLPIPFHTQKENYEEGIFYVYSFVDSAYIIVFQGALMEFPIDQYRAKKKKLRIIETFLLEWRIINVGAKMFLKELVYTMTMFFLKIKIFMIRF